MNTYAKFHAFITLRAILAIFNTRHLHYFSYTTSCRLRLSIVSCSKTHRLAKIHNATDRQTDRQTGATLTRVSTVRLNMLYLFSEEQFFIYFVNIILKSWGIFDSSGTSLGEDSAFPSQKVPG